ncbi:MAG: inositol monophosphatase family protein [Bacteroidales bacterium]
MDLKNICTEMVEAARETALFILGESRKFDKRSVESKGLNNFVSYVDRGAEEMLVEKLGTIIPEAGFITEEGTSEKKGIRWAWVIDPLDGTTNFMHGLHPYAISIGLTDNGEVVAGVIYEASGNEIFTTWKNGGAWLNGAPIKVSDTDKLSRSLVATGFPYSKFERLPDYMECLTHFLKHSHGVRRLGSASVDLAYVACGIFDAFYEYDLHLWDVAAGMLMVREAGGMVSDFSGNMKNLTGEEIIATNMNIWPETVEIVSNFMLKE